MKVCSCCHTSKDISFFHKDNKGKAGRSARCKECAKKKSNEWYANNKERASARSKEYDKTHSIQKVKNAVEWANKNPQRRFAIHRKWYDKNKEQKKISDKIRYELNKPHIMELAKLNMRKRRLDPKFKLSSSMSRGINASLHYGKQGRHWESLVGYTIHQLKKHIEKQFKDGISWENYGKWHIDHKIPIAAFNFQTPEDIDFKRCWALSNLQPMWALENIIKGHRLEKPFQPCLAIAV
jgi:hypothetical protein